MALDLCREAPLYEATLGVELIGCGAHGETHVEGERLLTVRLLEGSRPMASGGGLGLGGGVVQARIFGGGASSPLAGGVHPGGEAGQSSGREKVLHLELCDGGDPYFLYSLDVGEGDFHELRREHALLVDFLTFPQHFIELLKHCEAKGDDASTFHCALERGNCASGSSSSAIAKGGDNAQYGPPNAKFAVVEANRFKRVTHVALGVRRGDDADVKAYLAGRLAQTLAESDARRRGWDACARDLEALGAEHDALHEEKRGLVEAAREREASSDGANRERDAAHREALAAHVGDRAGKG